MPPPPAVVLDSAVDHYYGAGRMDRARDVLASEHGGGLISKVMANIFEYAAVDDGSGYRWDLEAWYGGDIHRLVFKTEGEGVEGDGAEFVETQALYSRAVGRYTDFRPACATILSRMGARMRPFPWRACSRTGSRSRQLVPV